MTREERANDYAEHNIGKYTSDYANIYNAYLKGADEEAKELKLESSMTAYVKGDTNNCRSRVEQFAQEQFFSFKSHLQEMMDEIEEEHKSAFMQGYAKGETDAKFGRTQLTRATNLIKRMLPLMPSGYNDMGNCDFIWEVRSNVEQFLKELHE